MNAAHIELMAQSFLISALRMKKDSLQDRLDIFSESVRICEVLDLPLSSESVNVCVDHIQRCYQLPDIHFNIEITI